MFFTDFRYNHLSNLPKSAWGIHLKFRCLNYFADKILWDKNRRRRETDGYRYCTTISSLYLWLSNGLKKILCSITHYICYYRLIESVVRDSIISYFNAISVKWEYINSSQERKTKKIDKMKVFQTKKKKGESTVETDWRPITARKYKCTLRVK